MRHLSDRVRSDEGTTLAEVLVAMTLLVLVAMLTMTMFTGGQRSAAQTVGRVQTAESARITFDAVTRVLRTATPVGVGTPPRSAIVDARDLEVTFHANNNPGGPPNLVRLAVDPATRTLTQTTTPLAWEPVTRTYVAAAPARARVLARNVVVGTSPVFRYLQPESVPPATSCSTPGGCPLPATPLSQEDRRVVRSILVTLTLDTPAVRTGSTMALRGRVHLQSTSAVSG